MHKVIHILLRFSMFAAFIASPLLAQDWQLVNSGVTNNLYDIFFIDKTTGWAVGADSTIIKTTDEGYTWFRQTGGVAAEYRCVYFRNPLLGWIGGTGGLVLSTTNGGESWVRQKTDSIDVINSIDFVNDSAVLQSAAERYRNVIGRMDADLLIGDILLASGDIEKAQQKYEFIAGYPQTDPATKREVQFRIAETHYFLGEFDKAKEGLEPLTNATNEDIANDALDLKLFIETNVGAGEVPLKQFARARFFERQGKYSEAAAMMKDIIVSFPTSPMLDHAWFAAALDQRKAGEYDAAKTSLAEFLTKFDDSILRDKVLFAMGDIYENELNNTAEAVNAYARLLADYPNSIYSNAARERILALREGNS